MVPEAIKGFPLAGLHANVAFLVICFNWTMADEGLEGWKGGKKQATNDDGLLEKENVLDFDVNVVAKR